MNSHASHQHKLSGPFTAMWAALGLLLLVAEFWPPPEWALRRTLQSVILVSSVVLEGVAIFKPGKGDTLSEQLFAFRHGKPARILLLGGLVGYMGIFLLEFGLDSVLVGGLQLDRLILGGGFVAWLLVHLWFEGAKG